MVVYKMLKNYLIAITVTLSFAGALWAQNTLVELRDIDPEEVRFAGFQLDNEQDIDVEAVGAHIRSKHAVMSTSWILRSDSRELVWELTDANSKWKSRKLREYRDTVRLPAGSYEVYYSSFPLKHYGDSWSWTSFFFKGRDDEDRYDDEQMREFYVKVSGNGRKISRGDVIDAQEAIKKRAIVNMTVTGDDEYLEQGFELTRPMALDVYCIGEARDDGAFDYGWIIDAESRKQVWKFDYRDSDRAGGSEKNRFVRETINLPKGKYAAFYVTDDSHSPRGWNSNPPYDPAFWGLTIFASDNALKNSARLYTYENMPARNVIVEFTRMRDDEFMSRGFSLKKDMDVRIYALGEGSDGDMFDYGWIVDAKTHNRVWEMTYRKTDHAGGARKNRVFDDIIPMQKGNYIVYFVSDGSHSYRHWNSAPPFDQDRWGITLFGASETFDSGDVGDYVEEDDKSVIARIVNVRDWETRNETFTMKKDGNVRIYAIGEGRDGRMFDYAWIEDTNGRNIWEMTYRKTNHAGGASKNREFNDSVYLKRGDYKLFFETDDSHSFRDWNASPPRDPMNYGVTIYEVDR